MASFETRRSDDGTRSYRAKVRLKGQPAITATFARRTDAKRWASATELAIREGRYFKTAEAKRHTLADLIDRYEQEVLALQPKNAPNTRRNLGWWRGKLGAYTLDEVTPARIVECRNQLLATQTRRKRPMSPATVVRHMAALSHAFTIAVNEWQWLDDSPMRRVSKPKEPRGRERFLSDRERDALLAACKSSSMPWLYPVVVLALSTGMRRGEILTLRWRQIDLERNRILLFETKNGTSRAVPLRGRAHALLSDLARVPHLDSQLLFPGNDAAKPFALDNHWRAAIEAAGIEDFRFHDLRHSAASYLAMNGASTIEIAAVLGHKTLQMVQRYSHLCAGHADRVVASMNEKIFRDRTDE